MRVGTIILKITILWQLLLWTGGLNFSFAQSTSTWLVPGTVEGTDTFKLKLERKASQLRAMSGIAEVGFDITDTVNSREVIRLAEFLSEVVRRAGKKSILELKGNTFRPPAVEVLNQPDQLRLLAIRLYDSAQYVPIPMVDRNSQEQKQCQGVFSALLLLNRAYVRSKADTMPVDSTAKALTDGLAAISAQAQQLKLIELLNKEPGPSKELTPLYRSISNLFSTSLSDWKNRLALVDTFSRQYTAYTQNRFNSLLSKASLTDSNDKKTLKLIRARWDTLQKQIRMQADSLKLHSASANVSTDISQQFEWFLLDLKEAFFNSRSLLRDLRLIVDTKDSITVLDEKNLEKASDSLFKNIASLVKKQLINKQTPPLLVACRLLSSPEGQLQQLKTHLSDSTVRRVRDQLKKELGKTVDELKTTDTDALKKMRAFLKETYNQSQALAFSLEPFPIPDISFPDSFRLMIVPVAIKGSANGWQIQFEMQKWIRGQRMIKGKGTQFETQERIGFQFPWIGLSNGSRETAVRKIILDELSKQPAILTLADTAGFNGWMREYGYPALLAIDQASLSIKEGIRFPVWKQCVTLRWSAVPSSDTCTQFSLLPLDSLPDRIKLSLQEVAKRHLKVNEAKIISELEKWAKDRSIPFTSEAAAKKLASFSGWEWIINNWSVTALLLLERLDENLAGMKASISMDRDGSLQLNSSITLQVLWQRYLGRYNWVTAGQVKFSPPDTYTVKDVVLQVGATSVRLGEAVFSPKNFSFTPADTKGVIIPVGGGFSFQLQSLAFDRSLRQFQFKGVTLNTPSYLTELAAANPIEVYYAEEGDKTQWGLTSDSEKKVGKALESSLRSRGLLPPGVSITHVHFDQTGLRPVISVDNTVWKEKAREVEQQVKAFIQPVNDRWLANINSKVDTLLALQKNVDDLLKSQYASLHTCFTNLIRGLKQEDLQRFLEKCQRHSGSEATVNEYLTIKYQLTPGRFKFEMFSPVLDCQASTALAKFEATTATSGIKVTDVNKACYRDWLSKQANFSGIDIESFRWLTPSQQLEVKVKGNLDNRPVQFAVAVGLDGQVRWDYDGIRKAVRAKGLQLAKEQLNAPTIAEARKRLQDIINELQETIGVTITPQPWTPADSWPDQIVCSVQFTAMSNITVNNVLINVQGKKLDFSESTITDIAPLRGFLASQFDEKYIRISNLSYQRGTLSLRTMLNLDLPEIDRPIEADVSYNFTNGKFAIGDLTSSIINSLIPKLLPWEYNNEDFKLSIDNAKSEAQQLVLFGKVTLSDAWAALNPRFTITIPFKGKPAFSIDKSYNLSQITKDILDKLFASARIDIVRGLSFENVRLSLDEHTHFPKGVSFRPTINIGLGDQNIIVTLPEMIVNRRGPRFANTDAWRVTIPLTIVMGPVKVNQITGLINKKEIELNAKLSLSPAESERILHLKGRFIFDLNDPFKWISRSELVVLTVFPLGYRQTTFDIKNVMWEEKMDFGGVLSSLISLKGTMGVRMNEKRMSGDINIILFKSLELTKAHTHINLENFQVNSTSTFRLPIGAVEANLSTQAHLSNPVLFGNMAINFPGLPIPVSNAQVKINAHTASLTFSALGIQLGASVPSYKQLDEQLIKDLLLQLLSPRLPNLQKVLEALLSGNLTINPFSNFGPAGGGISGGDGKKTGEEGNGENLGDGGPGNSQGNQPGNRTGGNLAKSTNFGELDKEGIYEVSTVDSSGEGPDTTKKPGVSGPPRPGKVGPILIPGSTSFFYTKNDKGLFIESEQNGLIAWLQEKDNDSTPLFKGEQGGWKLVGDGLVITTERGGFSFLTSQVPQTATLYWFTNGNKEKPEPVYGKLAFSKLNLKLDYLKDPKSHYKAAFDYFLKEVRARTRKGDTIQDFKCFDSLGVYAVSIKYSNESSYTYYAATKLASGKPKLISTTVNPIDDTDHFITIKSRLERP